jgi:DNA topoisomerase-1
MSDAKFYTYDIQITAPLDYYYKYVVEIPIFLGWKRVSEKILNTEDQNNPGAMLLYFKSIVNKNNSIKHNYIESIITVRNKHQHYTEATLINKLEELGIGRPSTFASLVETIQDRGYVCKTNIEGQSIKCKEFKLEDTIIKETIKERIFGNEKNKLVIQPIGILTLEFLMQYFQKIFSYEYTKMMEDKLDLISTGTESEWANICKENYNEIKELSKPVTNIAKQTYEIDETHIFAFDKYGPVIRHIIDNDKMEYISVKKDINIDLDKLKNKEYNLEDLVELNTNGSLGKYEDEDLFLKIGQYGPYVEWGEKRESIKNIKKPVGEITFSDIKDFLEKKVETQTNVLRKLNDVMSVRKSQYGAYVYYKREDMKKPQFLNIQKFNEGFFACEVDVLVNWLCQTYNLPNP